MPVQSVPYIKSIVPYKGGEAKLAGFEHPTKLSSNENPLGASPKAMAAFVAAASDLHKYPDGGQMALRNAIGQKFGLNVDNVICGAGSDEIFQLLGRAYLSPGDEIIQSEYGFLVYRLVAEQAGAHTISVKDNDYCADVDGILAAVTAKTRIVFIANPNNPTGTYLPYGEIKRLHAGLRPDILLVLDAAYAEFVETNDYASGLELVAENDNVIMTRTFSKIHGLAALRVGWCYGPLSVIDALNKVRGPFNVSGPAMAAAVASLEDDGFMAEAIAHNTKWLRYLTNEISAMGLKVTPSVANFILVHFEDRPKDAKAADAALRAKGLIVRAVGAYGLEKQLRMSVGKAEENIALIAALKDFMGR